MIVQRKLERCIRSFWVLGDLPSVSSVHSEYRGRLTHDRDDRAQDQEAEVRTAAAEAVVDFCKHAPLSKPAFMSEIMLPLKSLAADNSQAVRIALASNVLQLTSRCVHEEASADVLSLILALLKDKVRPSHLLSLRC